MPTLLTAVDTFDGSQIVDPVVVSNAFWGGLKGKIISVIIGQLLATIAFTALTSAVASQLPKIGETVGGLFGDGKARSEAADFAAKSVEVSMEKGSQARESGVSPDFGKLLLCILIDIVGTSSELLPVLGEVTDVAWAPVAALGLRSLFQSNTVFALEFAEEILPFTDVVPLATICWAIETFASDGDLAKALGIGSRVDTSGTVVDVEQGGINSLKEGRDNGR